MKDSNTTYYELTKSQLSLWTSQKLHSDVPLHNVAHTFEIKGEIDPIVFKQAFQELLNTTNILRTVFHENAGIPYQSFQKPWKYEFEMFELNSFKFEGSIDDLILERTQRIFDISKTVFDTFLLKLNSKEYLWYLNLHHLITDGVTTAALYNKMSNIYSSLCKNEYQAVQPEFTFEDYISFELNEQQNSKYELNRAFWKSKMKNLVEPPQLYGSKSNSANNTSADRITLSLNDVVSKRLLEISIHPELRGWTKESTLFNILATILIALIYRVSNQRNITIGTTIHNRTIKKFQKTPGFFLEVFPLVSNLNSVETFLTLYKKVKGELNGLLKNLKPGLFEPSMGRSYNVLMNFILTRFSDFNGYPTQSKWIFPGHIGSSNLIEFNIMDFDNQGCFELVFDINHALLNEEKRKNIPHQFERLLKAFLNDVNVSVAAPSLVSNQIADSSISIGPKTSFAFQSVIEQFEYQSVNQSDKIAIRFKEDSYSFETINNCVNRLAHRLTNENIGSKHRVAILLKRSPEYVVSVMAILKTGAAFVPIPANYPEERIMYMLEDSNANLLIGSKTTLGKLPSSKTKTLVLDNINDLSNKWPTSNLKTVIAPKSTAFIIYTSGSTGKPKGVVVGHEALSHYIDWTNQTYTTRDTTRMPLFTSVGFDITLNAVFLPLTNGGTIHIYQEQEGPTDLAILDVIEDNKVNYLKLTPSHLNLIKDKNLSSNNIEVMAVIGEELKTDLAFKIKSIFPKGLKLYNEYGPAEATIGCVYQEFTTDVDSLGAPIGVAIRNMETYLLDEMKNLVPHGVVGELYLGGIGLADGYWGKTELSEKKFIVNPFKQVSKLYQTRDLARMNVDGVMEYLGRTDFQVKLKGHRIELGEIESIMNAFEGIKESVVLVNQKNDSKFLIGFFVAQSTVEIENLQQGMARKLPQYMIPTHFQQLVQFPLSPNGKIDRLALKKMETTLVTKTNSYQEPVTEIETLLRDIWQEVLKETKIGVTDNFMSLGGHSLAAIRITSRINQEVQYEFKLNTIFELPTIKEYASHIEETLTNLLKE